MYFCSFVDKEIVRAEQRTEHFALVLWEICSAEKLFTLKWRVEVYFSTILVLRLSFVQYDIQLYIAIRNNLSSSFRYHIRSLLAKIHENDIPSIEFENYFLVNSTLIRSLFGPRRVIRGPITFKKS